MMTIFASLLCLLMSTAGIAFLRLSWRKETPKHFVIRMSGWGILLAALISWSFLFGAEFGFVLAFCIPAIIAWIAIALNAETRPSKPTQKTSKSERQSKNGNTPNASVSGQSSVIRKILLFIAAGPWAVVALCLISLSLVHLLPLGRGTQMVFVAFLYPMLLGIASYWICYNNKPLRDAGILFGAAALSSLHLFSAQIF